MDPIPRESTLEIVAGSHSWSKDWFLPTTFLSKEPKWFKEGSLPRAPDIDGDRKAHEIIGWELNPRDVVAFHMLALHGSAGSTALRRCFSVRMVGDDCRYTPREWLTSPQYEGLDDHLPAGSEMEHKLFPLLWS